MTAVLNLLATLRSGAQRACPRGSEIDMHHTRERANDNNHGSHYQQHVQQRSLRAH